MSKLAKIERIVFLQSVDLFSFCRAQEVLRIASISSEQEFNAGDTIYKTNQPASELHCVVRGSVALKSDSAEDETIGPLHTFGVTEILSGRLRCATATAVSETLVLSLDQEDFFDLLANNIDIVKALFRHLFQEYSTPPGARASHDAA
jgi:CRP-like cAMP-binding protein